MANSDATAVRRAAYERVSDLRDNIEAASGLLQEALDDFGMPENWEEYARHHQRLCFLVRGLEAIGEDCNRLMTDLTVNDQTQAEG